MGQPSSLPSLRVKPVSHASHHVGYPSQHLSERGFGARPADGPPQVTCVVSGQRLQTNPPSFEDERGEVGRGLAGGHRVTDGLAVLVGAGHGSGSSSNAGRPSMLVRFLSRR
jgi:hypothetical protein